MGEPLTLAIKKEKKKKVSKTIMYLFNVSGNIDANICATK